MIKIFFKIYTPLYIFYLKLIKRGRLKVSGKVSSDRFFRIEIARNARLVIDGNLDIKSNVLIAVRKNAKLSIGHGCFFNRNCSIVCREEVSIGNDCMFGENVKIYDHDHKIDHRTISKTLYNTNSITIESGCWIANDVNILKSSYIKSNSVIGAMSLVNKPLEQSGIYTGVPVHFRKELF